MHLAAKQGVIFFAVHCDAIFCATCDEAGMGIANSLELVEYKWGNHDGKSAQRPCDLESHAADWAQRNLMKTIEKRVVPVSADADPDSLEWKWEAFAERHLAEKEDWVDEGEQWINDAPRRDATVLKRDADRVRREVGGNKYAARKWTRGVARD